MKTTMKTIETYEYHLSEDCFGEYIIELRHVNGWFFPELR